MPAGADTVEIRDSDRPGVAVVVPKGDIDMSCSPQLRDALRRVQDKRPERIVVDLASVRYMDSSGLATLVEAMKNAKQHQTRLVLCAMNDKVLAIFEIARLHQYFVISDSLDQAYEA
ncbi:MAG: STAS domain-containing protein [Planctomycetota bacterium]